MNSIKLKINVPMNGLKVGKEIKIPCDSNGTPTDKFWRRRIEDSPKDNCVEVIEEKKDTPKKIKK